MRRKASSVCKTEPVKDCRIELLKKEKNCTQKEKALQIAGKEHDLWMYKNKKEEAKRLQGVRKQRKDEEMAWLDWEEARKMENGE